MNVITRPPQMTDLPKLLQFINDLTDEDVMIASARKQTLQEEKEWLTNALEKITHKEEVYLLAFDEHNNLLGTTHIFKKKGRLSHIGTLGISIAKIARGKGLGKLLMTEIIAIAQKELGIDMVTLTCFSINVPALRLYKSLGFTQFGLLPNAYEYHDARVDRVYMYKLLN